MHAPCVLAETNKLYSTFCKYDQLKFQENNYQIFLNKRLNMIWNVKAICVKWAMWYITCGWRPPGSRDF